MSEKVAASVQDTNSQFYGVYLLCSQSPEKRYNGKCYIGFTVNPNRRINQHNRGKDFGGARKTSNKGPWKMVMIVHGFPNNIAALQFEWAWQQPTLSTRLKAYTDLRRKQTRETYFQYNFRILSRMLLLGPWNRLPLVVRWLEAEFECDFPVGTAPPAHMQIVSGKIAVKSGNSRKIKEAPQRSRGLWAPECHLCMQQIDNPQRSRIGCLNSLCKLTCHVICLANHMICSDADSRGHYIPTHGECPLCETHLTWAELLRRKMKINDTIDQVDHCDFDMDDGSFDELYDLDAYSTDDDHEVL